MKINIVRQEAKCLCACFADYKPYVAKPYDQNIEKASWNSLNRVSACPLIVYSAPCASLYFNVQLYIEAEEATKITLIPLPPPPP